MSKSTSGKERLGSKLTIRISNTQTKLQLYFLINKMPLSLNFGVYPRILSLDEFLIGRAFE